MKSYAEYDWPLKDPNRRPWENQKLTTEFLLRNKRAYVLNEMRTGKTLSVLWACDLLIQNQKIRKVLVVSPLSTIKVVWAQSIFDNFPHLKYAIAHGNRDTRIRAIKSDAQFVIINHDGIKSVPTELINERFDIMVIDELTAYKNATSDRSSIMRTIAGSIPAVWGLTGDPTPNSPSEAFGEAKVVNPGNPALPRYFTKFKNMVEQEIAPYVWVPRYNAKEIVYSVLQPSIRFTRAECFDIPPVVHRTVNVEMSPTQAVAYKAVKDELYHQYDRGEITIVNAAVKLSKLLQISAGAVKNDLGEIYYLDDGPKFDQILETFEEDGSKKLVIASAFRASVEHLCSRLKKEKIKCQYIHGGVSSNARASIMTDFQTGDLQILVVQPQAVSHGTCFDASHITIWHSLITSGETYGQMNDRIVSASQVQKQFIDHLICSKADEHALGIVSKKKENSAEILALFANREL
jgi:SNF2 family DNA or RNA helicase